MSFESVNKPGHDEWKILPLKRRKIRRLWRMNFMHVPIQTAGRRKPASSKKSPAAPALFETVVQSTG
jgi:hypothetical protein